MRDAVHVPDSDASSPTVQHLQHEAPEALERLGEMGMLAYSGVPLLYQNRSLGTLCLFAHRPRHLSPNDLALQVSIAQQAGATMANAQLFQAVADERRRLKATVEASRDGIALIGPERLLVINRVAVELLALDGKPEQWVNRPLPHLLQELRQEAPDVVQTLVEEMRRVQSGDLATGEGEIEMGGRTLRWFNLPVPAGQATLGRLVVLQDVTEQRLVQRMQEQLRRTAVHDLRNPLNVVSGALDMLEQVEEEAPEIAPVLQAARRSTARMLNLVNGLLDVSRLESGRMSLNRSLFVMVDVVQSVVEAQALLAAEKDLALQQTVAPGTPLAWADFELVGRVLENLVGNAIKFTPAGGEIEVRVSPAADGQALAVSVADTGPGVAPEMQGRLFEKFVTGDHEATGTGLGLAFCRMVVEAHGGDIWVESEPGEGATFTFTLPAQADTLPAGSGATPGRTADDTERNIGSRDDVY